MIKRMILLLLCFLSFLAAQAQHQVTGTVSDEAGEALIGVTVQVKDASAAVSTDQEGHYSIPVPDEEAVLVFSYLGFTTREIRVGNQTTIDVTLEASATELEELVVVGYGTQQKRDLTSAISVVDPEDIQQRQATTVAEALQGLASGVNVRGGGRPGSEARIQIRGLKNLQGTDPLYVIDGLITTANRDFNPNDIESIQILKDASAAAIYGSRAANGVIIITTKKGAEGPMKINFSAKSSLQTMPRYDLAETEEFARLNFMAYDNAGVERQDLAMENNTDWQDVAYQTGNIQDYNLSFSGGNKTGSYYVSGNYFGNKGTVIDTDFDRYTFRVNSQASRGIFSIGENIAISNSLADEMSGNPVVDVFRLLPTIPVYDENNPGGYGYGSEARARTFGTNPVAVADLSDNQNENFRVRGTLWSELQILPSLKYRLNLGYETSNDHHKFLRKEGNWTLNQAYDPSIANENRARSQNQLLENTLTFNKTIGKHKLNMIAGQTYQKEKYAQIWGTKRNLLERPAGGYYDVLDNGIEPQTGGYENNVVLLSYLGRLEYNYDDRYLLNAVIRRDGSSRLSDANKWGNFPSVSAAWRISGEDFFEVPWINDLKIRASYGKLGSGNIGPYDYIPVINTFPTVVFGPDQTESLGAIQVSLFNTDLRWETLTQQNIGIDASLLNDKLTLNLDYFDAKTKDVLFGYPIALTTGHDGATPPIVNGATLQNTGFELSATYTESDPNRAVNYFGTLNFSTLKNKVNELGYGFNRTFSGNTLTELGQPVGMWYVLETDGLFQSEEDIQNYTNDEGRVIQPNAQPGDIRFKDNNGDGRITNDDKAVVASPWPDVELGLNLGASYKNFSFTMNWFGAFGATVFNGPRNAMDRFDDNSNYRSGITPWTPENPDTDFPRVVYASTLNARGDTDRWLESGSFFRLKYISLDYSIPAESLQRIGFATAQISLSAQNVLTLTKYTGLDPEFNNSNIFERGFDFGAFPNLPTYSLSIQVGF